MDQSATEFIWLQDESLFIPHKQSVQQLLLQLSVDGSVFCPRTLAGGAGGLNRPVLAWPVPVALASSHIHV